MERGAAFAADGKGINNVLAFPGLFRGALAAHAPHFTDAMLMAAAEAISQLAGEDLVPNPLDKQVHERVAAAVHDRGHAAGRMGRREHRNVAGPDSGAAPSCP